MIYLSAIEAAQQVLESLKQAEPLVKQLAMTLQHALHNRRKVLICGNGGSACEAQHFAAELVGRYKIERVGLPAIALSANAPLLTCLGNDFAFADIFARQVEALGDPGDLLVVFTTSGNSPNILRALEAARRRKLITIALLGRGGVARGLADFEFTVAHDETARIQEAHQFLLHALMDEFEVECFNYSGFQLE